MLLKNWPIIGNFAKIFRSLIRKRPKASFINVGKRNEVVL